MKTRSAAHSMMVHSALTTVFLALALSLGCVTRYTKAFFLPGNVPDELEYRQRYMFDNFLPETFHDWLVAVSVWSVWKSADDYQYKSEQYDVSILFALPEDTAQALRDLTPRVDDIPYEIRVDSLFVEFQPHGAKHTLMPISQRTKAQRRVQFDPMIVPSDVEAVELRFTAWLVNPDGTLASGQTFQCRLEKFYERERRILPKD